MSHRLALLVRLASFGAAAVVAASTGLTAEPSPHATVVLESGGKLRAEVHPTSADSETVILKAEGLLIELPKEAIDEATPADPVQVEYAARAAKAGDVAADHFALAGWCKANDLDPERQYELERTVAFDPDHEEARKALGYTKTGGKWVHPEQSMIQAGYIRYRGSWYSQTELQRILAQEKFEAVRNGYVRDMANWRRQVLRGGAQGQEAVLNFQRVTDPAAIFALRKLATDKDEVETMRLIYVDVLGRIPGGDANGLLVEIAMRDPAGVVREAALDRLVQRQATDVVPMVISQLYSESNQDTNSAAVILGRLGDRRAVGALIDVLVTERKRTVTTGNPGGGIGTSFGSGGGNSNSGISAGSSSRVVTDTIQNGDVLAALNAITGQNYRFDVDLWKRWYSEVRNVKNVNLRQLPR